MDFDHIFIARILFTLMTAGWAFLTVVADFNTYFVGPEKILAHDVTERKPTRTIVPGLVRN